MKNKKIKFFDQLNEGVEDLSNYSKKRKWKTYPGRTDIDLYFVYKLDKKERGKYLNTWFDGEVIFSKEGFLLKDEVVTLKEVDEKTANHLYRRKYNPIFIFINRPYRRTKKEKDEVINKEFYQMKAEICSIDDSSYGIWWNEWDGYTIDVLKEIRLELMKWINSKPIINGEEFFTKCINLGADPESKDYN